MRFDLRKILLFTIICFICGAVDVYSFPWSYDMWEQPSIKPYEQPTLYPQESITVEGDESTPDPREQKEEITNNPVASSEKSVSRGEELFNIYCTVCHGQEGMGDGPIVKKGLGFYPLNLSSPGVIGRTDGYIYAYIRYGGKVMMPSYRESISEMDAWHIVNYVRELQRKNAPPAPTTADEPSQQQEETQQ